MTEEFSEYYINIGLKVSYFRKKAGLTQEQLAERMGVATSFIGLLPLYLTISEKSIKSLSDYEQTGKLKTILMDRGVQRWIRKN